MYIPFSDFILVVFHTIPAVLVPKYFHYQGKVFCGCKWEKKCFHHVAVYPPFYQPHFAFNFLSLTVKCLCSWKMGARPGHCHNTNSGLLLWIFREPVETNKRLHNAVEGTWGEPQIARWWDRGLLRLQPHVPSWVKFHLHCQNGNTNKFRWARFVKNTCNHSRLWLLLGPNTSNSDECFFDGVRRCVLPLPLLCWYQVRK